MGARAFEEIDSQRDYGNHGGEGEGLRNKLDQETLIVLTEMTEKSRGSGRKERLGEKM